ncbi:MAG: repeat protein precursor, partial [Burkholderiales bacterium]|nr:repeat protein precursor [Burkholderiales bacterium]
MRITVFLLAVLISGTANSECVSCHTSTDQPTMHANPGVSIGCTDCHGGDAGVKRPAGSEYHGEKGAEYFEAMYKAHVQPRHAREWGWPSAANPERSYTLLNRERPEFIRFMNPGDYRVARDTCGKCHMQIVQAAERSLMATGAMFWNGAAYNNGLLPFKRGVLGESYTRDGRAASVRGAGAPDPQHGILAELHPLPPWETVPPADVFRVFE